MTIQGKDILPTENLVGGQGTLDSKVAMDIGRGLATLLISLAAVLIALAGIISTEEELKALEPILLIFSSLNILLAARIFDWLLDRIDAHSWARLPGVMINGDFVQFSQEFAKWDGAYFRMRIYGGAYFAFSIFISAVASTCLFYAIVRAQELGLLFSIHKTFGFSTQVKFLFCAILFAYIPYQMMTIESRGGRLFFFGGIFVIGLLILESIISKVFGN